jgi:hypothetical protein
MTIFFAITATSLGILGNIIIDFNNFFFFLDYFIPAALLVVLMYLRIPILKSILIMANYVMTKLLVWRSSIIDQISAITDQKVILFTRGGRLDRLHQAFNYITKNESSRSVILVHLYSSLNENEEQAIKEALKPLSQIFPSLKVEFLVREARFGPEIVDKLSHEFGVLKNNMFIGAPEEKHNFSIQDLGGVRIIF